MVDNGGGGGFVPVANASMTIVHIAPNRIWSVAVMSKLVTISLDELSFEVYQDIPKGARSRFMREVIMNANIVAEKDVLIAALRRRVEFDENKIKKLEEEVEMRKMMYENLRSR